MHPCPITVYHHTAAAERSGLPTVSHIPIQTCLPDGLNMLAGVGVLASCSTAAAAVGPDVPDRPLACVWFAPLVAWHAVPTVLQDEHTC